MHVYTYRRDTMCVRAHAQMWNRLSQAREHSLIDRKKVQYVVRGPEYQIIRPQIGDQAEIRPRAQIKMQAQVARHVQISEPLVFWPVKVNNSLFAVRPRLEGLKAVFELTQGFRVLFPRFAGIFDPKSHVAVVGVTRTVWIFNARPKL